MKVLLLSLIITIVGVNALTWTGDLSTYTTWTRDKEYGTKNLDRNAIDPKGTGEKVLQIKYPLYSYAGVDDKGYGVFIYPWGKTKQMSKATFEFEVLFPSSFKWVKGGKLPGMFGGEPLCTGGYQGNDCFSARFMWGSGGDGYPYLYIPSNGVSHTSSFCTLLEKSKDCKRTTGYEFDRKGYFQLNKWHKVKQHIQLNTVGKSNGILKVWVDGDQKTDFSQMIWRTSDSVNINGFKIESFFGGSTIDWRTNVTTYTLYKNFKFYDY